MKKQFIPFLAIAATGLLLCSCGNLSKISITKRHYRSGYYIDFARKMPASTSLHIAAEPSKVNCQTLLSLITTKREGDEIVHTPKFATEKSNVVQKPITAKARKLSDIKAVNYIPSRVSEIKEASRVSYLLNARNDNEAQDQAYVNVDIPFVVILLCAIFIPPLGVGLMYGINSYFWIDLLLTLLFFFPGMIFAIVVVCM